MQVKNGHFPIKYVGTDLPRIFGPVDGNIFGVMAVAKRAIMGDMRQVNDGVDPSTVRETNAAIANEMVKLVQGCKNYHEALRVVTGYVNFDFSWQDMIDAEEEEEECGVWG